MSSCGESQHRAVFEIASEIMLAIRDSPVPVIAAVDGLAAAAGCQLVAGCDIAICTQRSSFSTPGFVFFSVRLDILNKKNYLARNNLPLVPEHEIFFLYIPRTKTDGKSTSKN